MNNGVYNDPWIKISANVEDIDVNDEEEIIIDKFMFFGSHGTTLTGKDGIHLVDTTTGSTMNIPPYIAATLDKKYIFATKHSLIFYCSMFSGCCSWFPLLLGCCHGCFSRG
jgi:hypothetical protein